jgi:hypothetical protein
MRTEDGKEYYGTAKPPTSVASSSSTTTATAPISTTTPPVAPAKIEEDDLTLNVPDKAGCKRLGCSAIWENEDISRGSGEGAICRFHPQNVSWYWVDWK